MENSSYLVKPELYIEQQVKKIVFVEEIKKISKKNHQIILETDIKNIYIEFYTNGTIRLVTYNDNFDLEKSFSLEPLETSDFTYTSNEKQTIVSFLDMKIKIDHNPFFLTIFRNEKILYVQKAIGFRGNSSILFLHRDKDDHVYGLGEKTGFLNKNNEKTVNWNKDVFEPHTRSNLELYQSINMYSYMANDYKYGLFLDNPSRITFDFSTHQNDAVITSDIGKLDYYIFTDETLKGIIKQYTDLSGKTLLPPIWALGYHQSRHSYESQQKLLEIYHNFKNREIPVDAIYLDIMYMDNYKVFTFNDSNYPDIKNVIETLKEDGVKIVPIVDPGVKVEKEYSIYEKGINDDLFCKKPDGFIYTGEVWPGESAFYDFLDETKRLAWGENHRFYTDLGIEGIWNDMNEPAVFKALDNTMDMDVCHNTNSGIKTHQEVHNLYGLGMSMATYNGLLRILKKRPFVLTRAGYAGIQKYAFVWTGDNRSSWEHMEMTLPMCLNLNMSGVSLCGPDIGGFMDDCTEEMLIRWTQIGTFLPFFRNHSSIGLKEQEPWAFGEISEDIVRKYIRLRYELFYYIYSEVYKNHLTGIPVLRPLVLEFENDQRTYSIHDEFLLGGNILVAPILRPGEVCRKVYLPEGTWVHYFTNEKYEGNKYYIIDAKLDEVPVFIKSGSVIPITTWAMNTKQLSNEITIMVYPKDEEFSDSFIIDDGENIDGIYNLVEVNYKDGFVNISMNGISDKTFRVEIK